MNKSSKISQSKENLMNVAHDLFLQKGFSATSIDEICQKAKLTKGGFFHYFKSKDDLGFAVLERFCLTAQSAVKETCCSQKVPDPLQRIFANLECILFLIRKTSQYKGCLMVSFIQEMSLTNPKIQAICSRSLKQWSDTIKSDLYKAKKIYGLTQFVDVASLANHCVAVIEGSQVMAKATQNKKLVEQNIDHLKKYLNLIFKKQTPKARR